MRRPGLALPTSRAGEFRRTLPKAKSCLLLSAAKAELSEAQYRLALLDQPAIQAAQWLSVAAMTDSAYVASAQAALNKGSTVDQEQIKRQASLWVHAHQLERQLPAFSEPIGLP